jgi:hypothetical protein
LQTHEDNTRRRAIEAPRHAVWEVLADFPNIADWNSGVKHSEATSEETGGLGTSRHYDLAPMGALEETITGWDPTRPSYQYAPKYGPVGALSAPLPDRQLQRGFTAFLRDLETAAAGRS